MCVYVCVCVRVHIYAYVECVGAVSCVYLLCDAFNRFVGSINCQVLLQTKNRALLQTSPAFNRTPYSQIILYTQHTLFQSQPFYSLHTLSTHDFVFKGQNSECN